VLIRSIDRLPGTAELVELAAAGEDDEHDLGVTEHGEFVVLLDQAVAARPAGCSPRGLEMRRRRAGGDAGDLAAAPATRAAAMGTAALELLQLLRVLRVSSIVHGLQRAVQCWDTKILQLCRINHKTYFCGADLRVHFKTCPTCKPNCKAVPSGTCEQ